MTPFRLNIGIIYNISKNSFGKCSFDNVTKCHTQCKHRKKWTCPPPKKIRECPRINRVKRPLVAIVTQMEAKGEFGWCFHNAPRVKVRVNGVNKTVCFLFEDVAVRFQSPTDIYLSQVLNTVAHTDKSSQITLNVRTANTATAKCVSWADNEVYLCNYCLWWTV